MQDEFNRLNVPTIIDVARTAGVSKSTVSRVLNKQCGVSGDAGQKVRDAIRKLGYKPNTVARALKAGATKSIGLIIPSIENPIFPSLVRAITDTANRYGFSTILCNSDGEVENEVKYLELLLEKQVDGIIFNTMGVYDSRFNILKSSNTPVIVIGKKIEGFPTANINANNYKGAFMVVKHLLDSGMRNIAFIFGTLESSTAIQDRFDGYKAALKEYDIPYRDELIYRDTHTFEGGISAASEIMSRGVKFDAIFAANDIMAIGCMEKLQECGYKIPSDICVAGYDDIPTSRVIKPRLSTVRNPEAKIGEEAVKGILRMVHTKRDSLEERIYEPLLIIRESTRQI